MSNSPQPSELTEGYLRLLNTVDRGLSAYIHSLVPSNDDAQDVLQEVRITMWRHFPTFVEGSNPQAWARKIALHQILNHRRSERRRCGVFSDAEFIEVVAEEIDRQWDGLSARSAALRDCLRKLPDGHRKMMVWRYFEECGVEEIAQKTQRSVDAVYRLVSRIRESLLECMERKPSREGVA